MICDDCKHRDKCTKIISESAADCVDKSKGKDFLAFTKDYLGTGYVRYDECTEWFTKDFLKDYGVVWRKQNEYRVF